MMQPARVVLAIVLFSFFAAASADAQTLRLVVHPSGAVVRVVSGAVGPGAVTADADHRYVDESALRPQRTR